MESHIFYNYELFIEEAKKIRKDKGLTQARLATLVGKTTATISRFETGEKDIRVSTALDIARVLGMTGTN